MLIEPTGCEGLYLIRLARSRDQRGFFLRTYCKETFGHHGLCNEFVQSGMAFNHKSGTVRGMHYQRAPYEEIKVVRCNRGAILDVVVDLRRESSTYLRSFQFELSRRNNRMLYIPKGLAHGYQTLSANAEVHYMMNPDYHPESAWGVRWNDPSLDIEWPLNVSTISERDENWPTMDEESDPLRNWP